MATAAEVEDLKDLLDLFECGQRVVFPMNLTAEGARKVVQTFEYKQECIAASAASEPTKGKLATAGKLARGGSKAPSSAGSGQSLVPAAIELPVNSEVLVEAFRCPITQQLMREPMCTPSGHSYEAAAIRKVAQETGISPQTRKRLLPVHLIPNRSLKDAIDQVWKKRQTLLSEASPVREAPAASTTVVDLDTEDSAPRTPPRKASRLLQAEISDPKLVRIQR